MKTVDKIVATHTLLKAKLFKKRLPLIVSWSLTYRCNAQCAYCGIWQNHSEELTTGQILSLIEQMASAGTKRIHFTGGEPLLREDIEIILRHCKQRGISTALNSNGYLVSEKIQALTHLDLLSLSLDGPQDVHNAIRGDDSYQKVMEAIDAARRNNIKIKLITVLSKYNLGSIEFILRKAEELKTVVTFQPATSVVLEGSSPNPIAPSREEYAQVIAMLMKERSRNRYIGNSLSGLKHLYNWSQPAEIPCANSFIVCRLEPDGKLYGCADFKKNGYATDSLRRGFKGAFYDLAPLSCQECWCASFVELNCLFALKLDSVFNIIRLV